MPNADTCQVLSAIIPHGDISAGYNCGMANPRERARERIRKYFAAEDAPTQREFAERLRHGQSWTAKLLDDGPMLEQIDDVAAAIGMTPEQLIAPLGEGEAATQKQRARSSRKIVGVAARLAALEQCVARFHPDFVNASKPTAVATTSQKKGRGVAQKPTGTS
jgi:hypothetical protein